MKIKKCAGGCGHSICVHEDGMVWTWGRNDCGQLGHSNQENVYTPKLVEYFVENHIKAKECVAGGGQSGVITEEDELYVFGQNNKHQLGLGDTNFRLTPTKH